MTWPATRVRTLHSWIVCVLLAGIIIPAARADGPTLTASFGIAGHYRPGGWCPVTVTVRNPGGDRIAGQIQVLSADLPATSPYGRSRSGASSSTALFAKPIFISGGGSAPQTFQVYVRGIDPGHAEVTVQLVEGRERGDGRVLARISTQDQNTSAAVTGVPVADGEPLLVGFGGDLGAFTFLGGRTLAPAHSAGGSQTTQVASAAAADLPDKAAGYGGVDTFLLRSDAPVEALTEAQIAALKGWVAGGGHLIVCGGADRTRFASSFYEGLLPAAFSGSTLAPKRLPAVQVMETQNDGSPAVVCGLYGAGRVTLTAADPSAGSGQTNTQSAYWRRLLTDDTSSSLLPHAAVREENYAPNYYGGDPALLSQAVMRGPSLDAPGTEVIGLFLLVYLIVLVPGNYLVLKRLDRKELAWVTIPALVVVFALGTFAVGYAAKGGALFVNRAALIETAAGQHEAGVYSEIGLFSPRRTTYDLTVPGANVLAALPNPGVSYRYSNNSGEGQSYGQTRFVQTAEGASLPDMAYNMWSMRAVDAQSTADLGGAIDARFAGLTGTITNHTAHALTDCAVLWNGQWQPLGGLAAGASLAVTLQSPGSVGSKPALPPMPVLGQNDPNDTHTEIHARMRAALAEYVRSLGEQSSNAYYGSQAPQSYAPTPNEALLIGWSNDPALAGPPPRVDGHSVAENDVSLVLVHLPIISRLPLTAAKAGR